MLATSKYYKLKCNIMKRLSSLKALLILLVVTGSSYTSVLQAQESKTVAVNNFSELRVSAGIDLFITQSGTEGAKIVAQEDYINDVLIEKNGNSVHVGWKKSEGFMNSFRNRKAKVYINYKKLNSIAASSGSSLVTENMLTTDRLTARASSGASIKAKVSCADFEIHTSSGASADISGKADNMDASASSGGSIDAYELVTTYAKAHASSGGDVDVNVAKGLEASSSSGGSVSYKGNAALTVTSSKRSGVRHVN
jgi:hypothetical protein